MNTWYILKLWCTTILLTGPLVTLLFSVAGRNYPNGEDLAVYLLMIPFGFVLSLPSLIVSGGLLLVMDYYTFSPMLTKWSVNVATILGIFATFKVMCGSPAIPLTISYSIAIVLTSFLYRIQYRASSHFNPPHE
jgi:hypothetical protein